jgi:SOS-response transcriptional repressor LexA
MMGLGGHARTLRPPTPRQREILAYVHDVVTSLGRPPTLREIGEQFGITSTNAISDHLIALERRGLVVRYEGQARSVRVTAEGVRELEREVDACPTCGRPK